MNHQQPPLLRIARPSRDLEAARAFYTSGLGLQVLFSFEEHEGFDGVILGFPAWPYELELTRNRSRPAIPQPTEEDLLVFNLTDETAWDAAVRQLRRFGAREVAPSNPYWRRGGVAFEDPDGYTLILYRARDDVREPARFASR